MHEEKADVVVVELSEDNSKLLLWALDNLAAGKRVGQWIVWVAGIVCGGASVLYSVRYIWAWATNPHVGGP